MTRSICRIQTCELTMKSPRLSRTLRLAVAIWVAGLLSACTESATQPGSEPEVILTSVSGLQVSKKQMELLLARTARGLAMALSDPQIRLAVYDALSKSPYRERKLHFGTILREHQNPLLTGLARASGKTNAGALRVLDSIVDLEFYMPVKEHFADWRGGPNVIVGTALRDDGTIPLAFDISGSPVLLASAYDPPRTPTLSLVPVETDFSNPPSVAATSAPAAAASAAAVYMTAASVPGDYEVFLHGAPEYEVHAFVRNAAGNFVDLQCAGQDQAYPFKYNMDGKTWGGNVQVITEAAIGTNPVEFSMWENDGGDKCAPSGGRPPQTDDGTFTRYTNWGARAVPTVTQSGGVKTVMMQTLGIPLGIVVGQNYQKDDEVGELNALWGGCWPASGPARIEMHQSRSGHPVSGYAFLDFRFGQRQPVCPTPPPPPLSVSISGPTNVKPGAYCTWYANVSGGQAPYQYQWSGKLSGTNYEISGSLSQSGWLYLDVESNDDQNSGDEVYITVSSSGSGCIEL